MNDAGRPRPDHSDGADDAELIETLRLAQRFGFLGARPIEEAVAHARHFVTALGRTTGALVDLGSGGGLPGLVVAVDRPDLAVTLVDRRQKRTDFLERAVVRLGLTERVTVHCGDAHRFAAAHAARFDAVTARGFGPPIETLQVAARCRSSSGLIVISEPPHDGHAGERWPDEVVTSLGLVRRCETGVVVFSGG